uniref:Uncharacterized protein n=1 Tax=Anguilla anguilla TaxID=7936 RepID=A0A0E9RB57_ANGAN
MMTLIKTIPKLWLSILQIFTSQKQLRALIYRIKHLEKKRKTCFKCLVHHFTY